MYDVLRGDLKTIGDTSAVKPSGQVLEGLNTEPLCGDAAFHDRSVDGVLLEAGGVVDRP